MSYVYTDYPEYEGSLVALKRLTMESADSLLEIYSDKNAVPYFNGDNCHGDTFYYRTQSRMEQAVDFWIDSYKNKWFVRWVIVSCEKSQFGKVLGTVEAMHRNSRDYFGHCCLLRIDLGSSAERRAIIADILNIAETHFYADFDTDFIVTKGFDSEERLAALKTCGYTESDRLLMNKYSGYWIKRAVKNKFTVLQMADNILHITDGTGVFCTLIRGKKHALLVDTLWGVSDLPGLIAKLVSTPYTVVNTHCHPDHSFGNRLFERVLIPVKDKDVYDAVGIYDCDRAEKFADNEDRRKYENLPFPPFEGLEAGRVFDLGGLTVETVPLYGHTHGSLGFLVREERILLGGDAVSSNIWLFMKESLALPEAAAVYENALNFPFDRIISSHAKIMWPKALIKTIIRNIKGVMDGSIPFRAEDNGKILDYDTNAVLYSDENGDSCILYDRNIRR